MLVEVGVGEPVLAHELIRPDGADAEERDVQTHRVGVPRMERKQCQVAGGTRGVHEGDDAAGVVTDQRPGDSRFFRLPLAARCPGQAVGQRRCCEHPLLRRVITAGLA
jgi:hypothetical protein